MTDSKATDKICIDQRNNNFGQLISSKELTASALYDNKNEIYVLNILGGHFLLDGHQARHAEDIPGQS